MTNDETRFWILETVGEGGYSFRELSDHIAQGGLSDAQIGSHLIQLLEARYINVVQRVADKELVLSRDGASEALSGFTAICTQEAATQARHFIDVTEGGRSYLNARAVRY